MRKPIGTMIASFPFVAFESTGTENAPFAPT